MLTVSTINGRVGIISGVVSPRQCHVVGFRMEDYEVYGWLHNDKCVYAWVPMGTVKATSREDACRKLITLIQLDKVVRNDYIGVVSACPVGSKEMLKEYLDRELFQQNTMSIVRKD